MDGVNGYHSWRWIFILEGILTAVIAMTGYFFIPGFPEDATFISEEDKQYVLAGLKKDAGGATSDALTLQAVLSVFRDWQIWCMYPYYHFDSSECSSMILLGVGTCLYSLAFFIPTILLESGYTAVKAQLYSIPPGVCGIVWSVGSAFLADHFNHRFTFAIIAITMDITGFVMAGWAISAPGARYAGLFLAYMGFASPF